MVVVRGIDVDIDVQEEVGLPTAPGSHRYNFFGRTGRNSFGRWGGGAVSAFVVDQQCPLHLRDASLCACACSVCLWVYCVWGG